MVDPSHTVNVTGAVALGIATDLAAAVEAATGRSATEVAALATLANWADGHSIERLREVTGLSQPGCARLVDRLAADGLVRRGGDDGDRRVTTVALTAAGRRLARTAARARATAVQAWLARLPADDRDEWARLVDRLAGASVDDAVAANRRCRLCDLAACGEADCPVTAAIPPGPDT